MKIMKIAKVSKKQLSRASGNSLYSIQRKRMNRQKISPQNVVSGAPLYNTSWQPCVYSEIEVLPNVMPLKGTGTSGNAPWYGWLKDKDTNRNATRLHVINSNFGGLGGNYDGNIHPGSKKLNSNHLYCAENFMKSLLDNSYYDYSPIVYKCKFNWNRTLYGNFVPDPVIDVEIEYTNPQTNNQVVFRSGAITGPGMEISNNALVNNDEDSTIED